MQQPVKRSMKQAGVSILLALCGCTESAEITVTPPPADGFGTIWTDKSGPFQGRAAAKAGMKAAEEVCAEQGGEVQLAGALTISRFSGASSEIIFDCGPV